MIKIICKGNIICEKDIINIKKEINNSFCLYKQDNVILIEELKKIINNWKKKYGTTEIMLIIHEIKKQYKQDKNKISAQEIIGINNSIAPCSIKKRRGYNGDDYLINKETDNSVKFIK